MYKEIRYNLHDFGYILNYYKEKLTKEVLEIRLEGCKREDETKKFSHIFDFNTNKTTKLDISASGIRFVTNENWIYYENYMKIVFGEDWREKFNKFKGGE